MVSSKSTRKTPRDVMMVPLSSRASTLIKEHVGIRVTSSLMYPFTDYKGKVARSLIVRKVT